MRSYPIFLLALVAFLFVACEKDAINTTETDKYQQYLDDAEQRVAEADALLAQDVYVNDREPAIVVPPYSQDRLQWAINLAGPFGTVRLMPGPHFESEMVTITHPIRILGDPGAILYSNMELDAELPYLAQPTIFVDGAERVYIEGLQFEPGPDFVQGGTAILLSNADRAYIRNNDFKAYFQAIVVNESDFVRLHYNRAEGLFSEGMDGFNSMGYAFMSGKSAYLRGNFAEDFRFGFFVADKSGILYKNTATGGEYGFYLGKYSENLLELPDETAIASEFAANKWLAYSNTAQQLGAGYLVVDGANTNRLVNNKALSYEFYGFEFAGATERFGANMPTSFDNYFASSSREVLVKNCGDNNEFRGGKMVDTSVDLCD